MAELYTKEWLDEQEALLEKVRHDAIHPIDNGRRSPHTDDMSTPISREENDAKFAANAAKMEAIASDMRADMAGIRSLVEGMGAKIDGMDKSLNAKIDGMEKSLGARIDGVEKGVEGKIDGLKASVTTTQWLVAALLAVVAIVPVVTAIFSQPPAATPSAPAPVVITIPTQSAPQAPPSK